jgi:hypothetical protein
MRMSRLRVLLVMVCTSFRFPHCFRSILFRFGYRDSDTGLAALDQSMQAALRKYSVAGESLSVSYNGRLVFARGYA